jgi:hypothetical protein
MLRVYVAGKLNDTAVGYLKNVHTMISTADMLRRKGFAVFVPCNDLLNGILAGDMEYADYAGNNMAWLEVADVVYVLPASENSKGTLAEIARAKELKIPVVYTEWELRRVTESTAPKDR